jgi:hypothetical protein
MTSTTPRISESLWLLELRRHKHGDRCWWNHLEARWDCTSAKPH